MTTFLRLLEEKDKALSLISSCTAFRANSEEPQIFRIDPNSFHQIPGAPFAYWVSESVRGSFLSLDALEADGREARIGPSTGDDDRYVRTYWEVSNKSRSRGRWVPLNKGGAASKFYFDYYLVIDWDDERQTFRGFIGRPGRQIARPNGLEHFFRPGITWPLRTQSGFNPRVVPANLIFSHKGPTITAQSNDELLWILGVASSKAFELFVSIQISFGSYEVGAVQKAPIPKIDSATKSKLAHLVRRAWSLKRALDTIEETSHAFLTPTGVRARLGDFDCPSIEAELTAIQNEINETAFNLYGFSESDRDAALASLGSTEDNIGKEDEDTEDTESEDSVVTVDAADGLLSWAVGVAFGRFDWRLATGERAPPLEPDPFDPLPAKSPGMLPDNAAPFYAHHGILVDDQGHSHDLPRLIEEVLTLIKVDEPRDVRRWLQRDFFPLHLKQYSKSRRKAPIYWPLSTTSGSYTLWLYYPSLTSQTLYTAVNDFVEPKLKQVSRDAAMLRDKGAGRSREDEKAFEAFQALELELIELRDTLLQIAPTYRPNHDDGVQIISAPLWQLFRHKPWQKILKDTWTRLQEDDYNWAHLAMAYWPDRVREKCKTDKSLAIAHNMEELYDEPEPKAPKNRGRKKGGDA